jgi:hypothetical protein
MFAATRRLLLLLALHIAFFVCFSDAGPLGVIYGWASLTVWFFVVVATLKPLDTIGAVLPGAFLLCDILVLGGAGYTISRTMPQADNAHPYEKIMRGNYPTRADIRKGLATFGVKLPKDFEKTELKDIHIPNPLKDKK